MEIDQEIFNMMLAKSMHQIARIEFRNSKFPYARGLCPLATPARGPAPWNPRHWSTIWAPPPFQRLDPPLAVILGETTYRILQRPEAVSLIVPSPSEYHKDRGSLCNTTELVYNPNPEYQICLDISQFIFRYK